MKFSVVIVLLSFLCIEAGSQGLFPKFRATLDKNYDDEQFLRNGGPAPAAATEPCMKDLLIILDASLSVQAYFERNMKPFLVNLVTDSALDVSRSGTQVAMIIFSSADRTKVELDFGRIYDADDLAKFMDDLKWDDIKGNFTRTDVAFKEANNKVFTKTSPANNRPDADDVVLIITDGEPYGIDNILEETMKNVDITKDNDIKIVAAAVGNEDMRNKFRSTLQSIATSPELVVEADFTSIDQIRPMLVQKTCSKPAQCRCHATISRTYQIKPGESTAMTSWLVPTYACGNGAQTQANSISIEPKITSPHAFSRGDHTIKYTFKLQGGSTIVCPVTIVVRGKMCGDKAFDSCKQDCCCGTIHEHQPGYKCCGPKYYDPALNKCCDFAYLVSSEESCPVY